MIELDDVTKVYKMGETELYALDHVSLRIERGKFVSITGPSGSGKTTMLNLIGCIDNPTTGRVLLGDQDVSKLKERRLTTIRLKKIGFIFQQFYLIPTLNAIENIMLPMKEAKVPRAQRLELATSLLESVGLLARAKHYPSQLSGGEQQRVAIARALANEPEIVLADEPTGEIDSKTSAQIMDLLKTLNSERELTLIVVTHDPTVAEQAGRTLRLKDGRVEG